MKLLRRIGRNIWGGCERVAITTGYAATSMIIENFLLKCNSE